MSDLVLGMDLMISFMDSISFHALQDEAGQSSHGGKYKPWSDEASESEPSQVY